MERPHAWPPCTVVQVVACTKASGRGASPAHVSLTKLWALIGSTSAYRKGHHFLFSQKCLTDWGGLDSRRGGSREILSAKMSPQRSDVASGLAPGEPWLSFP